MLLPTISPVFGTRINSSRSALWSASIVLKWFANSRAALAPTCKIPRPNINLHKGCFLLASIPPRRLEILLFRPVCRPSFLPILQYRVLPYGQNVPTAVSLDPGTPRWCIEHRLGPAAELLVRRSWDILPASQTAFRPHSFGLSKL